MVEDNKEMKIKLLDQLVDKIMGMDDESGEEMASEVEESEKMPNLNEESEEPKKGLAALIVKEEKPKLGL